MAEPKSAAAFRTIGEVSASTGLAQHVLRYWETRFPQLRPVTRAGNRRYYRPEDVALVERLNQLLNRDGYTVKGVQKLLAGEGKGVSKEARNTPRADGDWSKSVAAVRDRLRRALAAA